MVERSKKASAIERREPKAIDRKALDPKADARDKQTRDSQKGDKQNGDVVLIHGVTEDGAGLKVLRARQNRIETGAVRPLKEGQPILGEVVSLRPRPDQPLICDVDVEVPAPLEREGRQDRGRSNAAKPETEASSHKGPPQVASDRYRRNWETIYNAPKKSRLVN